MSAALPAFAFVPGGTLDPTTIPKYVTPLVIPPEMPKSTASPAPAADYDIAVRQFKQQILPGGLWDALSGRTDNFPATTVWSYGRAEDPAPDISGLIPTIPAGIAPAPNSSFNYPSFTVEAISMSPTTVRWINDLKDGAGHYLPHLLPVDQTLHWANPPKANCVMGYPNRTDCETAVAAPYTGPVPFVTHVHGAHVQSHSDGYPEAWWLPAANDIPAGYAMRGSLFEQANTANTVPGSAYFSYENTQPATTLWYHDHALGMTRLNVYAGPAGFWLVRGGAYGDSWLDDITTGTAYDGVLPGPAPTIAGGDPNFNATVRNAIREVPIAIQDRSFNSDGSLFYPADRTFFDGLTGPFIGGTGTPAGPSDMPPIWNPEAFFNTMVVNGTTWPIYEVANARYRLRLLNGCNSRMLNLALKVVTGPGTDGIYGTGDDDLGAEIPFYQIGAEQGFLPKVVMIRTGYATQLPGDGSIPTETAAPDTTQALLMGNAERADVIVDFSALANGDRIRMINTGPDSPFGGFPLLPADVADPLTTGQVMDFVVNTALELPADSNTTLPQNLVLHAEDPLGSASVTRQISLNEMSSDQVCAEFDALTGAFVRTIFSLLPGDPNFPANCTATAHPPLTPGNFVEPMGPRQARMGTVETDPVTGALIAVAKRWMDPRTETPALNSTEIWEIFNTTADAHPVHLHLVEFQVVNRETLNDAALLAGTLVPTGVTTPALPTEAGYKDTVIAYPGQITRVKAKFDIAGLYVWHCHIVEHEDNEMMRSYCVANADGSLTPSCLKADHMMDKIGVFRNGSEWFLDASGDGAWGAGDINRVPFGISGDVSVAGDWNGTGTARIGVFRDGYWYLDASGDGAWGAGDLTYIFGIAGDIPVTGDWNGDGKTKIGVFRNGYWYLDMNGNGMWDAGDVVYQFGIPGDKPVVGDWTGSGTTKVGVFRGSGLWYLDASGDGAWGAGDLAYQFGIAGDVPVAGDWNGDGTTEIGVNRGGSSWYLDMNGSGAWDTGDTSSTFGTAGDMPVIGKW